MLTSSSKHVIEKLVKFGILANSPFIDVTGQIAQLSQKCLSKSQPEADLIKSHYFLIYFCCYFYCYPHYHGFWISQRKKEELFEENYITKHCFLICLIFFSPSCVSFQATHPVLIFKEHVQEFI